MGMEVNARKSNSHFLWRFFSNGKLRLRRAKPDSKEEACFWHLHGGWRKNLGGGSSFIAPHI